MTATRLPVFFAGGHERARDSPLGVDVGRRAVDLGQRRPALAAAVHAEILDRAALQLGDRATLGDVDQDFAGAWRVHLREHIEGPFLEPW